MTDHPEELDLTTNADRATDMLERPPWEVWWDLIRDRTSQLKARLPAELSGTIQFTVSRAGEAPAQFHMRLAGAGSAAHDGLAPSIDAWVMTSDAAIGELLFGDTPRAGAIRVSGRKQLFDGYFRFLEEFEKPKSWLEARIKR